jgi:hypothetical protein
MGLSGEVVNMKTCNTCGNQFPLTAEHFYRNKSSKDGFISKCKTCKNTINKNYVEKTNYHKNYYENNKEKLLSQQSEKWHEKHLKEIIEDGFKKCPKCGEIKQVDQFNKCAKNKNGLKSSCKQCKKLEYEQNKEIVSKRSKLRYEEKKEEILLKAKQYKKENLEWYRNNNKEYYQKNKKRMIENSKRSLYKRVKEDVGFRLLQRCRKRLYEAVKGNVKSKRTMELIGCSIEELQEHLESQFQKGMNWDNYGEWHVDHIKPCALFDFSKEENQRECFHYTNLQPLWAVDNIRKSDKYVEASK